MNQAPNDQDQHFINSKKINLGDPENVTESGSDENDSADFSSIGCESEQSSFQDVRSLSWSDGLKK